MAPLANTIAASSITSTSAKLNGSWEDDPDCCSAPCCTYTERFYYGTASPPTTLVSAGSVCSNSGSVCDPGTSYNKTVTGLNQDDTYYFMANVVVSGCGGFCSGSDNGSILSFKTLTAVMVIANPVATPAATTCAVSVDFTPSTRESTATVKLQYKRAVDPGYTDAATYSGLTGFGALSKAWNLSGLTAGTLYDFRFVATRNAENNNSLTSSVFQFTTEVTAQTTTGSETETVSDSVTVELTGPSKSVEDFVQVGFGEQVRLEIRGTGAERLPGVWFYHFPTQSYWFWTLQGFSAALTSTNGRGEAKTWIALGSEVYYIDDETYNFDDKDQSRPIDTSGEFEPPVSITPKAIDFKGRYAAPRSVEVKLGATEPVDPTGHVRLEVTADQYPGGPQDRRLLGSRTVDMAKESQGVDEWRRYSLGRVRPTNVVGLRLYFPRNQHPKRKNRVVIAGIKLVSVLTDLMRGRR